MHYLDSNTDFNNPITLYVNTRIESSTLVDAEVYSENENKLTYSESNISVTEGAYYQTISLAFNNDIEDKKTYTLLLKSGGILVYQSKIYVDSSKDFTDHQVRMTNGDYTSNTTNNDFIII
jgi:hypothetical protein|tara:strand:+ start:1610 stop:1972 length:363 start_codon:yes stop_codon:yes gene_type:complete